MCVLFRDDNKMYRDTQEQNTCIYLFICISIYIRDISFLRNILKHFCFLLSMQDVCPPDEVALGHWQHYCWKWVKSCKLIPEQLQFLTFSRVINVAPNLKCQKKKCFSPLIIDYFNPDKSKVPQKCCGLLLPPSVLRVNCNSKSYIW